MFEKSPVSLDNPPMYSNINTHFANPMNAHNPAIFSSNNTSAEFGCHGISNNVDAAAASKIVGGKSKKNIKRKIKNISNKYKKMGGRTMRSKKLSHIKDKLRSLKKKGYKTSKKTQSKMAKTARHSKKDLSDAKHELISLLTGEKRHHTKKTKTRRKKIHGGYHQYMSNVPFTPSYSTGGELEPSESALANPVIFERQNHCPV